MDHLFLLSSFPRPFGLMVQTQVWYGVLSLAQPTKTNGAAADCGCIAAHVDWDTVSQRVTNTPWTQERLSSIRALVNDVQTMTICSLPSLTQRVDRDAITRRAYGRMQRQTHTTYSILPGATLHTWYS